MSETNKKHILRRAALATALAGACLCAPVTAYGAGLSVKARLDSAQLLMGNLTTLHLEVVQDQGQRGGFTLLQKAADAGLPWAGVCGDSIELRTSWTADTLSLGSDRIQVNYHVPVQAFDSGSYRLPELVYRAGNDSALSNRVSLKVIPVNVTAQDPIDPFAGVSEPEGKSWLDAVPDWLYDFWWLLLIILLAIGAGVWALSRPRQGKLLPSRRVPEPSPYEKAMTRLKALKARKLWEQGMEKEYFTELTDTLRVYLEQRFGINAMEMTSRQIMDTMRQNPLVKDKRDYVRRLLDIADFVKFAKVRPLPADNIAAYDNAVSFIEETHALGAAPSEVGDLAQPLAAAPPQAPQKGGES